MKRMRSDDLKSFLQNFRKIGLFLLFLLGIAFSQCSGDIAAFNEMIEAENFDQALEVADKMVNKDPGDENALNRRSLALIYLGREQEALPLLEKILTGNPKNDDALNNMSWALYNLERYEESYNYILKALETEPNDEVDHINHGNVLLAMDKNQEARDAYSKALAMNPSDEIAIYGLASASYWMGDYEQAITQFVAYLKVVSDDSDALTMLGYSYLYSDQVEQAQAKADALMQIAENREDSEIRFSALLLKAGCQQYSEQYQQALETLKEAGNIKTDDDLYSLLGDTHYSLGNHSESIRFYNLLAELSPESAYPHIQNVYNYLALEDIPKAYETAEKAVVLEPENEEAVTALGNVYGWETKYRRAYDYFQQSVGINPDYVTGHVNSMWALYNDGLYRKCLEYGEAIADRFPTEPDIFGYIGDSWSKLQETEKAVENYKKALEHEENPVYFHYEIAMQYYYDQQYDLAEAAIGNALALEPENETCLYLKKEIERTKDPLSTRIADFVEQNYLYSGQMKGLDSRLKQFRENSADPSDVYQFIESIRLDEDIFTFCFANEDYDLYWDLEEGKTVSYKQILKETGKPVHYFDIDFFGFNTANEFIEITEELPDKEDSILVIDLRDNGGGLMESCAELLDYLLEYCVVGNLVYRDGTSSAWYSDEDAVTFEEIFVLINGNTASSSEMLTLGLKKYLPDVTVVGEPSYGKGVGQTVFDSRKDKVAVMLVNFYWNVKEENLMNSSIKPDIKVSGELEKYLEKVRAALSD